MTRLILPSQVIERAFVAIDPGTRSGVAIFRSHPGDVGSLARPVLWEAYERRIDREPGEVMQILSRERCVGSTVLLIEEQYHGASSAWKSVRGLVEIAGFWKYVARVHGYRVVTVNPATWQAAMLAGLGGRKRAGRKEASRMIVKARYGARADAWTDNVCDAVLMGEYHANNILLERSKL